MKTDKNSEATYHLLDMLMMYGFGLMATCVSSASWRCRIFFVGLAMGIVTGIIHFSIRVFRGEPNNAKISN